jgi:hypothetical protein
MSYYLDNTALSEGTITFPKKGSWYASFSVVMEPDSELFKPGSNVKLYINDLQYAATVVLNASDGASRRRINVVGGAAKMSTLGQSTNIEGPSIKLIVDEIINQSGGEKLEQFPSGLVGNFKGSWSILSNKSLGLQLQLLLEQSKYYWQINRAGHIAIVQESTNPSAIQLPKLSNIKGVLDSGTEVHSVQQFDVVPTPGSVTDLGLVVDEVEISFDAKESLLILQKSGIAGTIRDVTLSEEVHSQFDRIYEGEVTGQSGQTLNIKPSDTTLQGKGLDSVPMNFGFPGVSATVQTGTRVRFCFDRGDPGRPQIIGFENSTGKGSVMTIGDPNAAQFVALADKVLERLEQIKTDYDAHTHPTGVGPSGTPATPMTTPTSVASARLKTD